MADPTPAVPVMPDVAPADAAKSEATSLIAEGREKGWKSSEFIKHLLQDLAGFVVLGYAMWKGHDWLIGLVVGTGCVNANVYALARTAAKKLPPPKPAVTP